MFLFYLAGAEFRHDRRQHVFVDTMSACGGSLMNAKMTLLARGTWHYFVDFVPVFCLPCRAIVPAIMPRFGVSHHGIAALTNGDCMMKLLRRPNDSFLDRAPQGFVFTHVGCAATSAWHLNYGLATTALLPCFFRRCTATSLRDVVASCCADFELLLPPAPADVPKALLVGRRPNVATSYYIR